MAVASLTKITVPLSSDQSTSTQGLLMPNLQYRFRVTLENFGVSTPRTELTKNVISCGRPNVSFDPIDIHVYNSKAKLIGKPNWADITITFRDDVNNNVTKLVGEQLQKQFDYFEQSSASSGIDFKFTVRLETLDGGNGAFGANVIETWELYGCHLISVNYGQFDYSAVEPNTIECTIALENALQTPLGTGVGTDIGRALGSVITG